MDPSDLKQRISRLTNKELRRMLTTDRSQYRQIALDLAAEELRGRPGEPTDVLPDGSDYHDPQSVDPSHKKSSVGSRIFTVLSVLSLISILSRSISFIARPDFLSSLIHGLADTFGAIPTAIVGGLLVLPLGRILFFIRERRLIFYAWLELLFGVSFAFYTIGDKTHWGGIKTYATSDLATWMALGSSVYVVVRGLDNRKRAIIIKRETRDREEKEAIKKRMNDYIEQKRLPPKVGSPARRATNQIIQQSTK